MGLYRSRADRARAGRAAVRENGSPVRRMLFVCVSGGQIFSLPELLIGEATGQAGRLCCVRRSDLVRTLVQVVDLVGNRIDPKL